MSSGRRKAQAPCPVAGRNEDRCGTGRESRATSCCLAIAIPSRLSCGGGGGGGRRSQSCPQVPPWLEVGFSPGWALANPRHPQWCPRTTRPNSLFGPLLPLASCPHCGADLGPPFDPKREKARWPLPLCSLLCAIIFRELEGLGGVVDEAGQRLLPAMHPLISGYPRRDCSVRKTRLLPRAWSLPHLSD